MLPVDPQAEPAATRDIEFVAGATSGTNTRKPGEPFVDGIWHLAGEAGELPELPAAAPLPLIKTFAPDLRRRRFAVIGTRSSASTKRNNGVRAVRNID